MNGNQLKQILEKNGKDISRCRICKMTNIENKSQYERSLSIHHIDGNKKNNNVGNIIPICSFCHFAIHHSNNKGRSYKERFGEEKAERVSQIMRKNNAHYWKDKIRPKETRKKMSEAHLGNISGMKGKHHSKEAKQKMSKNLKGKLCQEEREKRRKIFILRNLSNKGKSYKEIYGIKKANEIQLKHSQNKKDYWDIKKGISIK
jgi:hypothetical protein